jgi:hypothetical protein
MYERAKRMTNLEHHVSHLEDDYGMREIIQGASIIPVMDHERSGPGQMAPLDEPQRLWGRPGWRESLPKSSFSTGKNLSAEGPVAPNTLAPAKRVRKKKSVRLAEPRAQSPIVAIPILSTTQSTPGLGPVALGNSRMHSREDNEDDEPMMTQWRGRHQDLQDAVEGGHEGIQNQVSSDPALAGDRAEGSANNNIASQESLAEPHRLSIAELLN